jgi:hypothetical protein
MQDGAIVNAGLPTLKPAFCLVCGYGRKSVDGVEVSLSLAHQVFTSIVKALL